MRILYVHQHFSTPSGATGTRSYEFARRLVAKGHEVIIVCGSLASADTGLSGPFIRGRREGICAGIRIIELELPYSNRDRFYRRSLTFLKFALRSIGIALREPYDLVFATSTPLTAAIPGIFGRWFRQKPFVFEVRDLWPELPKAMGVITNPVILWSMGAIEWLAYRSAHGLIGLSPGIVEGITRRGVDPGKVTMIPNGCDLRLFGGAESGESLAGGFGSNDFVAVYSGAHGLANGLDAILDAAAVLIRRGRMDIKLTLIGDGMCKADLQQRAEREGLDNVIFLDPVPKHDLARMFKRFHVGLMVLRNVPAFYRGTSPNKFFDYLAAGLPVVTNYPGWVADLIVGQSCGAAVVPQDAGQFADALELLADDRQLCAEYGGNSRQMAERQFSRDELGENFVDYICGIAEIAGAEGGVEAKF